MSRQEIFEPQHRDWRMFTYGAALLAPAAVLLVAWPRLATNLFLTGFAEQMFMPHGCVTCGCRSYILCTLAPTS